MKNFFSCFEIIKNITKKNKIIVACSGGIDSLSLTLISNEWAKNSNVKIVTVTVDHKLRKTSTNEAIYIHNLLKKKNIEHHILTWNEEKPKANIENIAREKRYELIFNFCKKNDIDTILLGHHIQDQAENFLIRLFRGSGILGLSSMSIVSKRNDFNLIRPFLEVKKDDLKEYLIKNNIKWVEDESNNDEKYLRNKIRFFLNSFENKDDIINRINKTIKIFQLSENIIKNQLEWYENKIYSYNDKYEYVIIKFVELLKLNKELQIRIINKIIKIISQKNKIPRYSKLENFLILINTIKKYTFSGCIFEKINNKELVCYKEYNSIKNKNEYIELGKLNDFLKELKIKNYSLYKELSSFKGWKKKILYTIPIKKLININ